MARVSNELNGQYWEPQSIGPVAQADLSQSTQLGALISAPIPATGQFTTQALYADGFKVIGIGAKSTQAGAINIQRYLDQAGLIPVGSLATVALTANTSASLVIQDNIPFQSFTVQITNTGGSPATLTNFALVLNAN